MLAVDSAEKSALWESESVTVNLRENKLFSGTLAITAVLCTNFLIVFADDPIIEIPWNPDLPAIGRLEKCSQDLGDDWFRGSVKWVCTVQWVCPLCRCTPEACGHVSIGH